MSIGVVLMTFGSATTSTDVPGYLRSVRGGSEPSPEVLDEFRRRYDLIGHSPLIEITCAQAAALETLLRTQHGDGFVVRAGMQHSDPTIATAVDECIAAGATLILGVVMSPQYSPVIMSGYNRLLNEACARSGIEHGVAGAWFGNPDFIATLAESLTSTLAEYPEDIRNSVPVIFTAHSLPKAVIDRDPGYLEQIQATVRSVVAAAGLPGTRWQFAYQSAGHTPQEWLTPDFKDLLPGLRDAGHTEVVLVPTQFLADHLEILYDIDIAGAEEAAERGMRFRRIAMPNLNPRFIRALAAVVCDEAGVTAS